MKTVAMYGKRWAYAGECFQCKTGEVTFQDQVGQHHFRVAHESHLCSDTYLREIPG